MNSSEAKLDWLLIPGTLCDERAFGPLRRADAKALGPATLAPAIDSANLPAIARTLIAPLSERFVVVGFSLGAQVAMEIARQVPERLAGMVLISTTAHADLPELRPARQALVERARKFGTKTLVEQVLWNQYVAAGNIARAPLKELIMAMAADTSLPALSAQIDLAITRPNSIPDLHCLRCPLLMINGAEDKLTPQALGAEIASAAPTGHHCVIAGAGHFVVAEQPFDTARAIRSWRDKMHI